MLRVQPDAIDEPRPHSCHLQKYSRMRRSVCRQRRRHSPDGHALQNRLPPVLEKPELYAVYRGCFSKVLSNGCFVELEGFRKKAEGLVHNSNISKQKWV